MSAIECSGKDRSREVTRGENRRGGEKAEQEQLKQQLVKGEQRG